MNKPASAPLRRALRSTEYFTLAFGSMIGVGWVISCSTVLPPQKPRGYDRRHDGRAAAPGDLGCVQIVREF